MDFEYTSNQRLLMQTAQQIVTDYGQSYFREKRLAGEEPEEFLDELAEAGFFGIPFDEEYGGEGLGMLEVVIAMETLGEAGAWSPLLRFTEGVGVGGVILEKHGTEEQKEELLPGIIGNDLDWAIGITEANTGTNMLRTKTFAERQGDSYVINGEKTFNSGLEVADKYAIITRTRRFEDVDNRSDGLTLFLTEPDAPGIEFQPIDIDIHWPLGQDTHMVNIDGLEVHESDTIGEIDGGAQVIWDALNPERITTGASHIGRGKWALKQAVEYAKSREVWGEPIGAHQGIQHPLAESHAELETASTMLKRAADAYDRGVDPTRVGELANVAHLQASRAAFNAADNAMDTFGGSSAAAEEGIAAVWSLLRHQCIAPVPENLKLNYIANNVLDLPRSYGV